MTLHPVLLRGLRAAVVALPKAVEVVAGRKSVVQAAAEVAVELVRIERGGP